MAEQSVSKRCSKCKEIKPLSEFYTDHSRKNGHQCYCKICSNKDVGKYRQTEKGRKVSRRAVSKYEQTEKGKEHRKCRARKHPEIIKARQHIADAIRWGKLPPAESLQCSCGEPAKHYHHWHGYEPEHWLDVIPVCVKCHTNRNKKTRQNICPAGSSLVR